MATSKKRGGIESQKTWRRPFKRWLVRVNFQSGKWSKVLHIEEYYYDHTSSKVTRVSSHPGPAPMLTALEETELVQWITKMAEIGYGQYRQQVTIMVKKKS